MSELTENFREEFKDKETRHIYAEDFLNTFIATQLKVLREDREWTQTVLADKAEMKQERISVLEDVNYESWSVRTLKRLARAFDLRLSIKFESFGSLLRDFEEFSREALRRPSFDQDPAFHPEVDVAIVQPSVVTLRAGTGASGRFVTAASGGVSNPITMEVKRKQLIPARITQRNQASEAFVIVAGGDTRLRSNSL